MPDAPAQSTSGGRPVLAPVLWLLVAIGVSAWALRALAQDALVPSAWAPLAVLVGALVVLAAVTRRFGGRPVVTRVQIMAASLLVVGPIVAEVLLRVSFAVDGAPTRDADLFATHHEDDYWLLKERWSSGSGRIAPDRVHPTLGWCQRAPGPDNPLGLYVRSKDQLVRDGRPKVLFYGDSYVAGFVRRAEDMIPCLLDDRLPETDVVHLGVPGYGTGQSYLLMRSTIDSVERPLVVMSAMTDDFDRAALRVRTYQKPRLVVREDGSLETTNVPVEPDPDAFFRSAPLSIRSFVGAALARKFLRPSRAAIEEKRALNRAILASTRDACAERGAELVFVLFHSKGQLLEPREQARFFVDECARLGIECLDTRPVLLAHMKQTGATLGDLYASGHHNERGNRLLADAILGRLQERGLR